MNMFIYDDDCGFCSRFTSFVASRVAGRVVIVPGSLAPEVYKGVLQKTSLFLICGDTMEENVIYTYNESIGALLQYCSPVILRYLGKVICSKILSGLCRRLYIVVAQNRQVISRLLFTGGSCSIN